MPGIFVQTVAFGAVSTSIGLAEDLQKGLIERFRALPMSRGAVLHRTHHGRPGPQRLRRDHHHRGRACPSGFRPTTGVAAPTWPAILLILLFAYALSWGFAVIGLSAPNSETAQVMSFPILFPLTFIVVGLRAGRVDAQLAAGVRHLPAGERHRQRLPGPDDRGGVHRHETLGLDVQSLAWTVGFLIVLIPLAIRRYRTRT